MTRENVEALSVRDLVRRRLGHDRDVWHLALVQRDVAWDEVRMRYLLDSLLEGYPIGSLLVCQVTGQSRVIRLDSGPRIIADADGDSWQLLDGQQRINALCSMLTSDGRYGHFYLHMTRRRDPPGGPVTTRRARGESLRYIHWQEESEADRAVPERERHIDLSRWYQWADGDSRAAAAAIRALSTGSGPDVVQILSDIDPAFCGRLDAVETPIALRRLERMLAVWTQAAIPVQYLTLGSPLHVLEVFSRINRAGVQVGGEDLFFAAVKTLWSDAEQVMSSVAARLCPVRKERTEVTPLVGRLGALRVLARLAARAVGQADLIPLTVDRLSGARGDAVITGMQALSDLDGLPLRRMVVTLHAVMRSSSLGFGLYSVDDRLWDEVLAWAAVNRRADDPTWVEAQLPSLDAYLLGTTSFRYAALFRDRFSRPAMSEALAAGMMEQGFPTQRIAEVAPRQGRAPVRNATAAADRMALADDNASLFLSVLQAIPYEPQRDKFDWDHIYPQAKAGLMRSFSEGGKWARHHKHRHLVGSAGNLWGLAAGANRAAQDSLPAAKFARIEVWTEGGRIWPRDRWWLSDVEIDQFCAIGQLLEAGGNIDPAMDLFQDLVTGRAVRMTDEVFRRLPEAKLFAGDERGGQADQSPEPDIAATLGIDAPERIGTVRVPGTPGRPSQDERLQQVLRFADECGTGAVLRGFIARVLPLGLQARGYQRTLTITPLKTKALALIAMTLNQKKQGLVTTWVSPWSFARFFPDVSPERFDEHLSGIRGVLLDSRAIERLAHRLDALLRPAMPAADAATSDESTHGHADQRTENGSSVSDG